MTSGAKIIVVAAPSGSGRKGHLKRFSDFCAKNGKKVKVYQIGQMLFEQAEKQGVHLTHKNILDRDPDTLNGLRSTILERILGKLEKEKQEYDAIIISLHLWFYWRKIFRRAYNYSYLDDLHPDMFVTIVTKGSRILEELNKRDQWRSQKLTLENVLNWQNIEVEAAAGFAQLYNSKFYAIPTDQPPSALFKLIFHPEFESLYPSFPITRLTNKSSWDRVWDLIKWLDTRFTVINHLYIQTGSTDIHNSTSEDIAEHNQTVFRDLYWLLGPCLNVVAFFPEIVPSWGVLSEITEAVRTTKNTWLIYPRESAGPFERYFTGEIFKDEEEFKRFIDEKHFNGNPPSVRFIE